MFISSALIGFAVWIFNRWTTRFASFRTHSINLMKKKKPKIVDEDFWIASVKCYKNHISNERQGIGAGRCDDEMTGFWKVKHSAKMHFNFCWNKYIFSQCEFDKKTRKKKIWNTWNMIKALWNSRAPSLYWMNNSVVNTLLSPNEPYLSILFERKKCFFIHFYDNFSSVRRFVSIRLNNFCAYSSFMQRRKKKTTRNIRSSNFSDVKTNSDTVKVSTKMKQSNGVSKRGNNRCADGLILNKDECIHLCAFSRFSSIPHEMYIFIRDELKPVKHVHRKAIRFRPTANRKQKKFIDFGKKRKQVCHSIFRRFSMCILYMNDIYIFWNFEFIFIFYFVQISFNQYPE